MAPRRGAIYDRDGTLLAFDVKAMAVAIDSYNMTRPLELTKILTEELGLSAAAVGKLIYRSSYFTWIHRKVDLATAKRIEERADKAGAYGLIFLDAWRRLYPQGQSGLECHRLRRLRRRRTRRTGTRVRPGAARRAHVGPRRAGSRRAHVSVPRDRRGRAWQGPPPDARRRAPAVVRGSRVGVRGPLHGAQRHDDRARPRHGRRAGDGAGQDLRPQRVCALVRRAAPERGGDPHLRAGLDLQGGRRPVCGRGGRRRTRHALAGNRRHQGRRTYDSQRREAVVRSGGGRQGDVPQGDRGVDQHWHRRRHRGTGKGDDYTKR